MSSPEHLEKIRQEVMRFQELLDLLREKLEEGERAYARLFAGFRPQDIADMKEKDLQRLLAETLQDDVTPLRNAVLQMRFEMRNMERDFEHLDDIIMTPPIED